MDDTIAAISTPIGTGGIAIIRVSGPQAHAVADVLVRCRNGTPSAFPSHTVHYGTVSRNGTIIDQVLLTVMRAPKTYTGEDTVEINCHGGLLTARAVLARCLEHGARLAEPGEFTKRAFLNGRMDLAQAEAVMDVITAKTDRALAAAERALAGQLSARIGRMRDQLLDVLAHCEAHIDFPDEDLAPNTREQLLDDLASIDSAIAQLLNTVHYGRVLRDGVQVAIVGRPNVGKSSLMNALLGRDRAIVTPVAGTTRDIVEDYLSIDGIPVRLTDTAGIRKARGTVEEHGVNRSRTALRDSELVILVLDGSRPISEADQAIADECDPARTILVINKTDLPNRLEDTAPIMRGDGIKISATANISIDILRTAIADRIWSGAVSRDSSEATINDRHARCLESAQSALRQAIAELRQNQPLEIAVQPMRVALDAIGEIIGKTATEDILDRVFAKFCIGK